MSFLAPLFLAGGLALALPVVFHLIRRTTRERTVFSSLMFLAPTPPRLTRRSRLENLLLLLLRCLVLALLVLGFARPFLKDAVAPPDPEGLATRTVVLMDASASMQREGLWSTARSKLSEILGQMRSGDEAAVMLFSNQIDPLVQFEEWKASVPGERTAMAMSRLGDRKPTWSSTQLGAALIRAAELLAEADLAEKSTRRRIVLISDFQEGGRMEALQGYEWPKEVELSLEPVRAKDPGNAGLQLVAEAPLTEAGNDPVVRVRISNAADSTKDQLQVGWGQSNGNGFAGKPIEVYVPAGQSRVVPVPVPPGQTNLDRIMLRGDVATFDNVVSVIPPETARSRVIYLGTETESETRQPLYFLKRAFPATRRQLIEVDAVRADGALTAADLKSAALVIVTDALSDERAALVREQALAGGTVLVAPRHVGVAPTVARLVGVESIPMQDRVGGRYSILGELDFRHPLLAPFADPRFSDFSKIHFWRHRQLSLSSFPGARAVAKFDSGDPALIEVPTGKGRMVLLASGWNPDDSQLALSTKFVPLLFSLLELGGGVAAPPAQHLVGDLIPLPARANAPWSIRGPDGTVVRVPAGSTNYSGAVQPGIYVVEASQPLLRFAVNLDPAESRTAPLPLDELERLGAPVVQRTETGDVRKKERQALLQTAEAEARQKLWRWFLVGALTLLLIETAVAGWTLRQRTLPEGVSL